MLKFLVSVQNWLAQPLARDDRGATAVEYGLIVALIAAVIIGTVLILGQQVKNAFQDVVNQM